MSYLLEWQKQQKAQRDAERDRKQNAFSLWRTYRGDQQDISTNHQKQQKVLKDAQREKMRRESSFRHKFRGGGNDISSQHQQNQRVLRNADRAAMRRESSLRHKFRDGGLDVSSQHQKQQRILRNAEHDKRKNASRMMNNYQGGEHDITNHERDLMEQRKKNAEQQILHSPYSPYRRNGRNDESSETEISFGSNSNYNSTDADHSSGEELRRGSIGRRTSLTSMVSSFLSMSASQLFGGKEESDRGGSDDSVDTNNCEAGILFTIEEGRDASAVFSTDENETENEDETRNGNKSVENDSIDEFDLSAGQNGYYDWNAIPSDGDSGGSNIDVDINGYINGDTDGNSDGIYDGQESNDSSHLYESQGIVQDSVNRSSSDEGETNLKDDYDNYDEKSFKSSPSSSSSSSSSPSPSPSPNRNHYFNWIAVPSGSDSNDNNSNSNSDCGIPDMAKCSLNNSELGRGSRVGPAMARGDRIDGNARSERLEFHDSNRSIPTLRGIMFNSDVLRPFPNSHNSHPEAEDFYDAKEEFSDCDAHRNFRNISKKFIAGPDKSWGSDTNDQESEWRKVVRFFEDEDDNLRDWYNPIDHRFDVLDVYNESAETLHLHEGYSSMADFYRELYTDEMEETSHSEYESEDGENKEKNVVRNFLYLVGLSIAVEGIQKLVSALRKKSNDETGGEDKALTLRGEMTEDVVHAAEFAVDSASALNSGTGTSSALNSTGGMTAYSLKSTGNVASTVNATTSAASTSASMSASTSTTSASASASVAASSASASTSAVSASASAAASSASLAVATSSTSLGSAAAASAGAMAAGQATAVAAQAVVVQSMAVSAVGTASASIAGASSAVAAVASATAATATATATVSTSATVAVTTAAMGVVAISAGAAKSLLPVVDLPSCPQFPVDTQASVKISFARDSNSLAFDVIEGNGEWEQLGSQIVRAYNNASADCHETHQRRMLNCSYVTFEYGIDDMIDTFWDPFITCNTSCPIGDPLFGVDSSDPITRLLEGFDPIVDREQRSRQSIDFARESTLRSMATEESYNSSSSETSLDYKIPISRTEFLNRIGASSVDPVSSFLPITSFQAQFVVSDEVLFSEIEKMFIAATKSLIAQYVPSRHLEQTGHLPITRALKGIAGLKVTADAQEDKCIDSLNEQTCVKVDVNVEINRSSDIDLLSLGQNARQYILSGGFEDLLQQQGLYTERMTILLTTSLSSVPSSLPSQGPSSVPSAIPSLMPSASPSTVPSAVPSDLPSAVPSSLPSKLPSQPPSVSPSARPSSSNAPSMSPSDVPSEMPSDGPSAVPSASPSHMPSYLPSGLPSETPSAVPSSLPSMLPSQSPSESPSSGPSASPSHMPSSLPSGLPSETPSAVPSSLPSMLPSQSPSESPSSGPSASPSHMPSSLPSGLPSETPSALPSSLPSVEPSGLPSKEPSESPSGVPSGSPSFIPSSLPSEHPSIAPSVVPSMSPSVLPSLVPSFLPSLSPSFKPSVEPSISPSGMPSTPSASVCESTEELGWVQVGSDIDGEAAYDQSGYSVSLSSDGQVVAIGANYNDGNGSTSGHVRVYEWNSGSSDWNKLGSDIDGEKLGDYSGWSVSLSSDGQVVAIGAAGNDGNGSFSGHVRVYEWNSGSSGWVKLGSDIDGERSFDRSGYSVSLSRDGERVAIGAYVNDGNGSSSGHVRVYEWNSASSAWVKLGSDIDGEAADDQSGSSVSLSSDGQIVAIGALYNDGNGHNSGHVRVYEWNSVSSEWIKLGSDIDGEAAYDRSGRSVSLSSDGQIVAIGASSNDGNGSMSGHVRVYEWNSGSSGWNKLGSDIDGEAGGDESGWSVSLSSDGQVVAIGAIHNDGNGSSSGHVRVYEWNSDSSGWVKLGSDIDGEAAFDESGHSVSMSSDGRVIASGAYENDGNGSRSGHVRMFQYCNPGHDPSESPSIIPSSLPSEHPSIVPSVVPSIRPSLLPSFVPSFLPSLSPSEMPSVEPSTSPSAMPSVNPSTPSASTCESTEELGWVQVGSDIDGEAAGDQSGYSVSLSSDGQRVAIGATGNDGNGSGSGHVRVYQWNTASSVWNKLGSDIDGEAADDGSGISVSLSSNGQIVAIGATGNDGNGSFSGHVRVYEWNSGSSNWDKLGSDINGEEAYVGLGTSVSLSSDGQVVAIGALYPGLWSGHVRVYEWDSGGSDWIKLGSDIDGEAASDQSGTSVSLSSDGQRVAIGAPYNDGNGHNSGHVRVYEWNSVSSDWDKLGSDINGEAAFDGSGISVSLSSDGQVVAIGASSNDGNGDASGHVRVYEWNSVSSDWDKLGSDIDGEAADDYSGSSAFLSSDGQRVAIGAYGNDGNGRMAGHVRVYEWNSGSSDWDKLGSDIDGEAAYDWSGYSMSLSSDGQVAALGAIDNDGYGSNSGHVRIFQYCTPSHDPSESPSFLPSSSPSGNPSVVPSVAPSMSPSVLPSVVPSFLPSLSPSEMPSVEPSTSPSAMPSVNPSTPSASTCESTEELGWVQVGSDIDGEAGGDQSGYSVSLSSNGQRLAIGAPYNDGNGSDSGHVRVYEWDSGSSGWIKLGSDIDGEAAYGLSGFSVSLSSDGQVVAIGAITNNGNGSDSGHVRVYEWNSGSSDWVKLGSDIDGEKLGDYSGWSVSLSSDGQRVAIGARYNDGYGSNSGHVRVYEWNTASSDWNKLGSDIDGEAANDLSGWSVSLSRDGQIVAIGARYNDDNGDASGHVRVYEWNSASSDWDKLGSDIDGEAAHDYSGSSVSLSSDGQVVAIGASYNDGNGDASGHVRVYEWNSVSSDWDKLGSGIDGEAAYDYSGSSVSLSSDGQVVAIGAHWNDGNGSDSGHVRVYEWNSASSAWVKLGSDIDGEAAEDYSGNSVSLSSDGQVVAIGAIGNDGNGSSSGHVRIFQYCTPSHDPSDSPSFLPSTLPSEHPSVVPSVAPSMSPSVLPSLVPSFLPSLSPSFKPSVEPSMIPSAMPSMNPNTPSASTCESTEELGWVQVGSDIDGEAAGDYSGCSVSLSSDGQIVAIGAHNNDGNGSGSGHVRVYEWNSGSSAWDKLGSDIDGEAANDYSGYSVSLSSDGQVVAIGGIFNDGNGSNSGHVRVYEWNSGSSEWNKLGSDIDGEAVYDWSGHSVSLSSNGERVAIGAYKNDGNGSESGHVRVYEWNSGSSHWVKLGSDIDGEAADDRSGCSVSLSSDGQIVAIGAYRNDGIYHNGSRSGHVRVYEWNSVSSDWNKLGSDIDGEASDDESGWSVSLSSDGQVVAIGAPDNDGNSFNSGHVRVYEWDSGGSDWIKLGSDIDGEAASDQSGTSVSLSSDGQRVAFGAPYNDGNGSDSGRVRVYEWNSGSSAWNKLGSDIDGEAVNNYSGRSVSLSSDGQVVAIGATGNDGNGSSSGHVRIYQYCTSSHDPSESPSFHPSSLPSEHPSIVPSVVPSIRPSLLPSFVPSFLPSLIPSEMPSVEPSMSPSATPSMNPSTPSASTCESTEELGWVQVGSDIDGEAAYDYSGRSVSLSSDGQIVAIGAAGNDGNGSSSGHVRVYEWNSASSAWNKLGSDIDGEAAYDYSGRSVSLSSDGQIVAIGATGNDGNGSSSGHVRVYEWNSASSDWDKLGSDIDGEATNDQSGYSVSLSSDGQRVAIGATRNGGNVYQSGHVRVYEWNSVSSAWVKLGSDIDGEAEYDFLGFSVSLSSDGGRVAIGAPYDDGNGINSGHVRVYEWNSGSSDWDKLGSDIDGEAADNYSGWSVSLSSNGQVVAIGAYKNDGNGSRSGHVRVYEWNSVSSAWDKLGSDIDGEAVDDESGTSVSLSSDGQRVAIGAIHNDGNGSSSGHVRVYEWNSASSAWNRLGSDIDGEAADDSSGNSVSLSSDGHIVAIGAIYNAANGSGSGHVRIFQYCPSP